MILVGINIWALKSNIFYIQMTFYLLDELPKDEPSFGLNFLLYRLCSLRQVGNRESCEMALF